jgi:hypothetical protein
LRSELISGFLLVCNLIFVQENIAYGVSHYTQKELIHAAKQANAHEFIAKFDDMYKTLVGDRGVQLSGTFFIKITEGFREPLLKTLTISSFNTFSRRSEAAHSHRSCISSQTIAVASGRGDEFARFGIRSVGAGRSR